jgi:hypothetical protein
VNANPPAMPTATSGWPATHRRSIVAWSALYLGALAVVATGVVHIEQYSAADYSTIPTIGTLFLLNFISAVVIGVGLVAPYGRVAGRYADAIRAAWALAGIGLALLSLIALFVSESSSLFNFHENGYRTPIVLAMVAEAAATVFLLVFLAANGTGLAKTRSQTRQGTPPAAA